MGDSVGGQAVLVGHGPSVLETKRGWWIDQQDYVIRQKRCQETLKQPKYFGTKTTAICASWTVGGQILEIPSHQHWIWLDSRHDEVTAEQIANARLAGLRIMPDVCREWDKAYRALRIEPHELAIGMERTKASDELGHKHMSAGLHTLVYACEMLRPATITLLGFDNVRSGGFTWSITRGPEWTHYPDHRWDVEQRMVPMIAEHYQTEIIYA